MNASTRQRHVFCRGFSLVEMFAAIAIVALIISGVIFYVTDYAPFARKTVNETMVATLNEALTRYKMYGGMTLSHSLGGQNTQAKIAAVVQALKTGFTMSGNRMPFFEPNKAVDTTKLWATGLAKNFYFCGYGPAGSPELAGTYVAHYVPPPISGLVARWSFDAADTNLGGNTTNDVSGNGHTGTLANLSSHVTGAMGEALQFNGSNTRVTFGTIWPGGGTAHSFTFWVNAPASPTGVVLGRTNAASITVWFLGGNLRYSTGGGALLELPCGSVSGTWTHFAITRNGTAIAMYKNGALLGSGNLATNDVTSYDEIGARGAGSWLSGSLDDVRMYDRALSAAEVAQIYGGAD